MANFLQAHKIVMVFEGGYANTVGDKGGETYKGISRIKFPLWAMWPAIDQIKKDAAGGIKKINALAEGSTTIQQNVLAFYKQEFWDDMNLDLVNDQPIATELYDTGVNMGVGRSGLFLQRTLNITDEAGLKLDAQIGPKTIAILNNSKFTATVLKILNVLQGEKYIEIIEANPSQDKFFRSWFSRVSL